jgi:predicted nucleotide-binding protein (sugar kinase/HSP70/actin superfamily)
MEQKEDAEANHQYNWPIVASSQEVIRNIIDAMLQNPPVTHLSPFRQIDDHRFRGRKGEEFAALRERAG